jgi:hypothetical protein
MFVLSVLFFVAKFLLSPRLLEDAGGTPVFIFPSNQDSGSLWMRTLTTPVLQQRRDITPVPPKTPPPFDSGWAVILP